MEKRKAMRKSLKKNLAYQILYETLVILAPLITTPAVSRALGPENSGVYSYTYSIASYFVLFCMLGIKNHGSRVIAENSDNQVKRNQSFSNIMVLHIGVSAAGFLVYLLYVFTLVPYEYKLYAQLQGMYVLSSVFDISWFFIGIEEIKLTVTRNIVIRLLTIGLILVFVRTSEDLWKYIFIMAGGTLLSQVWLWLYLKKFVSFVKPDREGVISNLKPLIILFIPVIAVSLYKMMDKIMIGWFDKGELGYYEYAERIIAIPMSIIEAIGVVMLPRISKMLAVGGEEESKQMVSKSMKYNMIIAFAMSFGIASISNEFAPVFFGESYLPCANLMIGLSITIPFLTFANVLRKQFMIPKKMDRAYIVAVFCGAAVNLVCNVLLIPRLYARGAMVGTILAEIAVCIMHIQACKSDLPINDYLLNTIPFLSAGFCMFCIVRFTSTLLDTSVFGLLMQVFAGGLTFVLFAVGILLKQKDPLISEVLSRIKSFTCKDKE